MLERAEGGLPVIEPVIEGPDAVQLGVRLEGLADLTLIRLVRTFWLLDAREGSA